MRVDILQCVVASTRGGGDSTIAVSTNSRPPRRPTVNRVSGGNNLAYTPIRVEVAPGELIDKITILEIKSERIEDARKLTNVRVELDTLVAARDEALPKSSALDELTRELRATNEKLWDIEDDIRDCERNQDFSQTFIELARAVYHSNDQRAALKREINQLFGSRLVEEKSYREY